MCSSSLRGVTGPSGWVRLLVVSLPARHVVSIASSIQIPRSFQSKMLNRPWQKPRIMQCAVIHG